MTEGAGAKFPRTYGNNDICDELILSKEGMRLEERKVEGPTDDLLKEAEAVLAQTEDVLKTRKDALYQRHVQGEHQHHQEDLVFKDPKYDLDGEENYLDKHRRELLQREREQELQRLESLKSKRSHLFNWNLQTD